MYLQFDLNEIGEKVLPDDLGKGKLNEVQLFTRKLMQFLHKFGRLHHQRHNYARINACLKINETGIVFFYLKHSKATKNNI